ncbi:Membrane protein YdfJ [Paenibacillus solanacearum]|uniref:Membrane protein YdfJ n=1 Tax=Paenibacillus solanacearum TaxID=2048548 RepID=A0A916K7K2_9BACL|nr:MMPL family transporter [Paenibacillus solanacearum]CAG7640387.1 Membrane protein YdfJ [Paenibacillus solanacearum]
MRVLKLALLSVRYPKTIILLWMMALLLFGWYALKLPAVLKDHGLTPDGAYVRVERLLSSEFHIPRDPVMILFEQRHAVSDEQFRQYIAQTLAALQGIDGLAQVVSPLEREGMLQTHTAYALFAFQQPPHEMKPVIDEMQRRLPRNASMSATLTGKPVVQAEVNRASRSDLGQAERLGIPAAFLILWLAFGSLAAAAIPVVIGVIGVACTMGLIYWLGHAIEMSNFVLNVIPMVGLALSIDFALMLVSRFREELVKQQASPALMTTMQTAGRAVLYSAACVFFGLVGILFIPLPMFTSIAIGAMTVLTMSALLAFTLVPALLYWLAPVLKAESSRRAAVRRDGFREAMAAFVMKRPIRLGLLASVLLVLCLAPLRDMQLAIPDATSLPPNAASRAAFEAYQAHFVDRTSTEVYFIAQGVSPRWSQQDWQQAFALAQRLERDPAVRQVESVFSHLRMSPESLLYLHQRPAAVRASYEPILSSFVKDSRMLMRVTLEGDSSSPEVMRWLRQWEREGTLSALPFMIGGEGKYRQEVFDCIFDNIKYVLFFIFISNYAVLLAAFQSVLLPVKMMAMNLLSLGASFGILTWIFQEGRFGIEPGSIAIMIPVFIFGLVFGISMDYGVFLVSRMFEAYRHTRDNSRAVLAGLSAAGGIINSAAAMMIAVTAPFALGEVAGVKQLGIGIAAAILIDATIIRMVLVPSLMHLLGKWNWWCP